MQCNKTACAVKFIAVAVFLYVYDYLVHQTNYIMDLYAQTSNLWRPAAEMGQYAPWFAVRYIILAAVITCLYKKFAAASCAVPNEEKKPCPIGKGACFGFKIGLLMGTLQASSYIWMPISEKLAITWFLMYLVQGIGAGIVLGFLSRKE